MQQMDPGPVKILQEPEKGVFLGVVHGHVENKKNESNLK